MIVIRPLEKKDALALRDIRLTALQEEGRYFTANLKEESSWTKLQWEAVSTETTFQAMFGAFDGDRLVGILGARRWEDDLSGRTVYWRAAYIRRECRHDGLDQKLFALRQEWCVDQGFNEAVFTIHAENRRAIDIRMRYGAVPGRVESKIFADGKEAPAIWFHQSFVESPMQYDVMLERERSKSVETPALCFHKSFLAAHWVSAPMIV